MRKFVQSTALAITFAISAPANAATVYDAFVSFNATNGAGNFSWISSAPGAATLLTNTSCVINNTICLGLAGGAFNLPGVFKSTGLSSTTHPYQPLDRLLIHPGDTSALIGFFNAPVAGEYSFTATLDALTTGTTVGIFALHNAGGAVSTIGTGFLNTLGASRTFSGTYTLAANEFIAIGLNNAGNFSNDSTGLRFTVTRDELVSAVPEPATWAMMIVGLGLVGWSLRRGGRSSVSRPALASG